MATAALMPSHNDYFFQQLSRKSRSVLALDYDRTVGRLGPDSKKRFPSVSVRDVLGSILATTGTQVVLVSRHGTPHAIPRTTIATLQQQDRLVQVDLHTVRDSGCDFGTALNRFLVTIGRGAPLAYVTTPACSDTGNNISRDGTGHLVIRPQFFVRDARSWSGEQQEIVQFLVDWVRACGGELC